MHKADLKNPTSRDIIEAEQMRRYIAVPLGSPIKKTKFRIFPHSLREKLNLILKCHKTDLYNTKGKHHK